MIFTAFQLPARIRFSFSSSIHWPDTGSGTPFLGIVGRKKTIPSHSSPMTGIPFFPLSFGMLRLMSATKVDRGEGKPAKFP